MKIGFLYEHPTWSDSLIDCFRENGVDLQLINVAETAFDTNRSGLAFDLCINRVNMMPSAGRAPSVVAHTLHLLHWLETAGVTVINGARAHFVGASKAVQNGVFTKLGLDCPASVAIHRAEDARAAAEQIGFPVIVKPNIGGSGSGVARFDSAGALAAEMARGGLDLGIDGTGLVQEYVASDGFVYRVEVLGDALFYGIRQGIVENQFNYCAADGCSIGDGGAPGIEPFEVPPEVLANVLAVCRAAGADVGGVEFFRRRDAGSACYYDFNPYSNFVANGEALFGFSPEQRFVDFVMSRAG